MAVTRAPPHTKKDLVTEFRRTAILDAARRAFARGGYEGTTVDSIAAEADIAKGTVYLYYKSKADICLAAVSHGLEEMHEASSEAIARATTCRAKIEQFIRIKAEYIQQHRDFYRIYVSEFSGALKQPTTIQKQIQKLADRQTKLLEDVIAEGVQKKEIRPVPVGATALAIYDLSRGLVKAQLNDEDRTIDYHAIIDLLWNGLRPSK